MSHKAQLNFTFLHGFYILLKIKDMHIYILEKWKLEKPV